MSRVGKYPIKVPAGVTVTVNGKDVEVKGTKGTMQYRVPECINVSLEDSSLSVQPVSKTKEHGVLWGTARARLNNMIVGVSEGFTKKLELVGVGYKAQVQGKDLKLSLGFSHDVLFPIPEGINITCASQTEVEIHGMDKKVVGQVASEIRSKRPPEPYKGKGVKYKNEHIFRKEGKKK